MSNERVVKTSTPWLWLFTFFLAVLKLTGLAEISWLMVFSPILIAVGVILFIFIVTVIIAIVKIAVDMSK